MNNICKIPKNSKFYYGSGGSTSIIVITPDKKAYKYFIVIINILNNKKNIKKIFNENKKEIKILEMLSKLKKNTPHMV
jgi:hypothetical protein